jgi:hypothetical protein
LCVFALWCMGTLALASSIRSPQVVAAEEAKGGEEETAGTAGHLHTRKSQSVPWQMPCSAQCISVYSWHGPIASYQPAACDTDQAARRPSRHPVSRASRFVPCRAVPCRAMPSRAEPSRAELGVAESSRRSRAARAGLSRAELSRASTSRAQRSRAGPNRAELSRAEPWRAEPGPVVACRRSVPSLGMPWCGAVRCGMPARAVPCRAARYQAGRTNDQRRAPPEHPQPYRHPRLELSAGGSAATTWGERMEEVRASVPMHHSANTHNTPPPRRPTTCTTRGGGRPHPTCIDIPASPWQPGASPPPRACRGVAARARLGAWAVWLSDGPGWCLSAKQ